MPEQKKLLIVDGYNVLRSGSHYEGLRSLMPDYGDEAFNAAREALINDVGVFAGHEYHALVVFDGGGNRFSDGQPSNIGGVEVVFSPAGVTADTVIEERAKQAAAKRVEVLVVTSDATTQWTVLDSQVRRMSAKGFYEELKALESEMEPYNKQSPGKNTLGERLPPEVLKELKDRFG
ncbi:MAG: NYN domain-containing protein [Coriobacteriia bacterium]|nr:NYN domain-containing protein [Coriobacteriia bacterium]MCL2136661.1 NYN domain-containing protein [Coriobacteriia bacterium]